MFTIYIFNYFSLDCVITMTSIDIIIFKNYKNYHIIFRIFFINNIFSFNLIFRSCKIFFNHLFPSLLTHASLYDIYRLCLTHSLASLLLFINKNKSKIVRKLDFQIVI